MKPFFVKEHICSNQINYHLVRGDGMPLILCMELDLQCVDISRPLSDPQDVIDEFWTWSRSTYHDNIMEQYILSIKPFHLLIQSLGFCANFVMSHFLSPLYFIIIGFILPNLAIAVYS